MFPTFTGSARRTRQVNLSGRNTGGGGVKSTPVGGTQLAVAHAQQERLLRQRERDRWNAARKIQRVWQGYRTRRAVKARWRSQYDLLLLEEDCRGTASLAKEEPDGDTAMSPRPSTGSGGRLLDQLCLLLRFLDTSSEDDLRRLDAFTRRLLESSARFPLPITDAVWRLPLLRLTKRLLEVLAMRSQPAARRQSTLVLLEWLARAIPEGISSVSHSYYRALSSLTRTYGSGCSLEPAELILLIRCLLSPLQAITPRTLEAFDGFIWEYLTTPDLPTRLGSMEALASGLNYKLLIAAMASSSHQSVVLQRMSAVHKDGLLWLLAYIINLRRLILGDEITTDDAQTSDYPAIVSSLLSPLAQDVAAGIDADDLHRSPRQRASIPLAPFVREQISSLLNQRSITSLVARSRIVIPLERGSETNQRIRQDAEALVLASYVLTLLRAFPRRGDDIRMWLYLGSTTLSSKQNHNRTERVPTLRYFWEAMRDTHIFRSISQDPRSAVDLIRSKDLQRSTSHSPKKPELSDIAREREWRIALVFLELYSFVLKVIDDDEFFSGSVMRTTGEAAGGSSTWTRESALPLKDVEELTVFLKNLGFAMHWYAAEIEGIGEAESKDEIKQYFTTGLSSRAPPQAETSTGADEAPIAGIDGMTMDYFRGTVTGVLRMLYEREYVICRNPLCNSWY